MENGTLRQISRTGLDGYIPIYTPIHGGISKSSTPYSSDSNGTRISIGTSGTSTVRPDGSICRPGIANKRKSATPNLRYSNKLDTPIDVKFTKILSGLPIFTDVVSDKISNIPSRDIYARVGIHLATDPVNFMTPQFLDLGFSTVDALDK